MTVKELTKMYGVTQEANDVDIAKLLAMVDVVNSQGNDALKVAAERMINAMADTLEFMALNNVSGEDRRK